MRTPPYRRLLPFVVLKSFDLRFQSADFPLDSVQTVTDASPRTNPQEEVPEPADDPHENQYIETEGDTEHEEFGATRKLEREHHG